MILVSMKEMLQIAMDGHYAVGQFNLNGLQWAQGILEAAEEEESPIILAASDRLVPFLGGYSVIAAMMRESVQEMGITVPVALHLDHGQSVDNCKRAIDAGFSSVMIDGSHHPIAENIAMTSEVTAYAHAYGVSVEAEVGTVGGMEDGLIGGIRYADPEECAALVKETGVDALAAALGSVHGPYQGEPVLGFAEMEQISKLVGIPLVLHGASGIPYDQLQRSIKLGHAKININTECIQAWTAAVRRTLEANPALYDPRSILTPGTAAIKETVRGKIREFGSAGKAFCGNR
ncbi:class II fructose-1,6-bisphosphate aldolase [Paenibacillus azoreducens]|uniref:6-phospho-5-dehydro-2-deoxy-D-gluconate aldolase n=1 Tax=Paenibacillus azoreducens TaxID=116718 RepID=A0A920CLY0_9BACL|nr:class II fructose-1,6-bisphosphate aldolase [Paenibacillus azoreducens]GIO45611.1 6-phospho-5-dehydro-2-deoxy-D-gluconate aldolase [Paenibacillus azoreducens]